MVVGDQVAEMRREPSTAGQILEVAVVKEVAAACAGTACSMRRWRPRASSELPGLDAQDANETMTVRDMY